MSLRPIHHLATCLAKSIMSPWRIRSIRHLATASQLTTSATRSFRSIRHLATACLLALGAGCGSGQSPSENAAAVKGDSTPRFVERSAAAGLDFEHVSGSPEQRYILESMSSGAAFFDADGDNFQDLFLVNSSRVPTHPEGVTNRLYRNVAAPDGGRSFADVTAGSGLADGGWGMGCAVGDIDNDGDVDLYVTYWGANVLYANDGDGRFSDITATAGVGDRGWSTSAAFGDLDEDGLLDLFVANYLVFDLDHPPGGGLPCSGWRGLDVYCGPHGMRPEANVLFRNEGGGRFAERTSDTGVSGDVHPSLGVALGDFDDDGDRDIYVANDGYPNVLYRNDGDWRLEEVATWSGAAYSEDGRSQAGMGVASGDYDGDGDLDLFVTHFSDDVNTLYQNQGDGRFRDQTAAAGLAAGVRPYLGWGTAFLDADNDGWLDLFVANGHIYPQVDVHPSGYHYAQRNLFYRNLGGRFTQIDAGPGLALARVSRGLALADYDNDGDIDLLVMNLNEPPDLLHNVSESTNHWLGLRLQGRHGKREALGARVRLHAGGGRVYFREVQRAVGYLSQSDPRLLFGLGHDTRVDSVVVRWPGGRRQVLRGLEIDRYHVVEEGVEEPVAAYAHTDRLEVPDASASALVAATVSVAGPAVTPPGATRYKPPAGATAEGQYRDGMALYEQGRFEEASDVFRWLVDEHPDYLPGRYSLAVNLFSGMGRLEEARQVLEDAVRLDSTRAEVFRLLGVVFLNLDRSPAAVTALRRAVALDGDDWESHSRLGLAFVRLGDLSQAQRAFLEATRRAPWKPQPHLHLAELYEREGHDSQAAGHRQAFVRLRPAEEAVERALHQVREFPGDALIRYRLGLAYLGQGRYQSAAEPFRAALDIDPSLAAAHHGLGASHHLRGQLAAAIDAYRRSAELDPGRMAAHADLAQACLEARRFEEAVAAFDRALQLDPGRLELRARRGIAAAAGGRIDDGVRDLRAVLAADPDHIESRVSLAQIYGAAGRLSEAVQQWQAVLRLDPDHAEAGTHLSQLRLRMADDGRGTR